MNDKEFTQTLAAQLGDEVGKAVNYALQPARARGIVDAATTIAPLVACGQLIVECVKLAWAIRSRSTGHIDKSNLVRELLQGTGVAKDLDHAQRAAIVAIVVGSLPEDHRGPPQSRSIALQRSSDAATEQSIAEFMMVSLATELGGDADQYVLTRGSFGKPLYFTPFADMDYFCVLREFHWKPDQSADRGAVAVSVPRGFVTDLASVPRPFWSVVGPTGKHGQAAIFHDWLYWQQTATRAVADHTFDIIMRDLKVSTVIRKLITKAVQTFGGKFWDESRAARERGESRILRRLPEDPRTTCKQWRSIPQVFA